MSNVSERAAGLSRASLIALGFSIPISAAADGILVALIALGWLAAARFRETAQAVRDNPAAAIACIWFLAHALGALWSIGEAPDVLRTVSKAATFLLVPIAISILLDARQREWALDALMAAIGLTAVLSTVRWFELIPVDTLFLKRAEFSATVVFKYHLTQNLLVAFGAFLFAVQARRARTVRLRCAWAAAAAFAAVNVLVMGDGRIGQIVLVVLLLYFVLSFATARAIAIGSVMIAAAVIALYLMPDSALQRRASAALSEAYSWSPDVARDKPSSIGSRLDYYRTSAHIIAKHPLLGVGSGGFPAAYEQAVSGTALALTRNPHNEYLLRAVELGAAGFVLLCSLFVVVWQQAARLATQTHMVVARGLVITFAIAGLASSPLGDHTETLLFVWLAGVLFAGYRPAQRDLARPGRFASANPGAPSSG
jgi:O-antigen ligase